MRERNTRLQAIMEIIEQNRIESQDELLDLLHGAGFEVTQATLSRDLKSLKVGKVSDGGNGYYYTMHGDTVAPESIPDLVRDIQRGFIAIEFSGNLAVIHTLPGHADSVAFALDRIGPTDILGTVAGDDTIFCVLKEEASKDAILRTVHQKRQL